MGLWGMEMEYSKSVGDLLPEMGRGKLYKMNCALGLVPLVMTLIDIDNLTYVLSVQ